MKKSILLFFVTSFIACKDSKLKNLEAKLEDSKCKSEKMERLLKYDNIMAMAISLKLEKEYEKAFASYSDTTLTCEEANKKWDDFMKLYDSAQKKAGY